MKFLESNCSVEAELFSQTYKNFTPTQAEKVIAYFSLESLSSYELIYTNLAQSELINMDPFEQRKKALANSEQLDDPLSLNLDSLGLPPLKIQKKSYSHQQPMKTLSPDIDVKIDAEDGELGQGFEVGELKFAQDFDLSLIIESRSERKGSEESCRVEDILNLIDETEFNTGQIKKFKLTDDFMAIADGNKLSIVSSEQVQCGEQEYEIFAETELNYNIKSVQYFENYNILIVL